MKPAAHASRGQGWGGVQTASSLLSGLNGLWGWGLADHHLVLCLSWLTQDSELSSWPSWLGAVLRTALWRTKGLQFLSLIAFLNHVIARPSSDLTIEPQDGYACGNLGTRVGHQADRGRRTGRPCADRPSDASTPPAPSTEGVLLLCGFRTSQAPSTEPGKMLLQKV